MSEQTVQDPRAILESSSLVASHEQVEAAVTRLAAAVNRHYGDRSIILLVVMTGAILPAT